jgi:hypothetical protein
MQRHENQLPDRIVGFKLSVSQGQRACRPCNSPVPDARSFVKRALSYPVG